MSLENDPQMQPNLDIYNDSNMDDSAIIQQVQDTVSAQKRLLNGEIRDDDSDQIVRDRSYAMILCFYGLFFPPMFEYFLSFCSYFEKKCCLSNFMFIIFQLFFKFQIFETHRFNSFFFRKILQMYDYNGILFVDADINNRGFDMDILFQQSKSVSMIIHKSPKFDKIFHKEAI